MAGQEKIGDGQDGMADRFLKYELLIRGNERE